MSIRAQINRQIKTFTETLGITAPVMSAPMTGATTPELVAAVSQAGGLGVLPCALMTPEEIFASVSQVKTLTDRPFAVNLRIEPREPENSQQTQALCDALEPLREELGVSHTLFEIPNFDAQFEAVLTADVPAVSFSFGGPREVYAEALEARGILMIGAVNSTREAKVLKTAGCQIIVAQGAEAAGPRVCFENPAAASQVGLGALLPPVVRVCGEVPVAAAGAMMSARAMLAAMMNGASGAVLGSYLLRTPECAWPDALKNQIAWCDDAATRLTDVTSGRLSRVLPTGLTDALTEAGLEVSSYPGQLRVLQPIYRKASEIGRLDLLEVPLGQAAQTAPAIATEEAVKRLLGEFEALLGEM